MATYTPTQIYRGIVLAGVDLSDLDEQLTNAPDGDAGGTYVPSSNLVVSGTPAVTIAGDSIVTGGTSSVVATASHPFVFGRLDDQDYFRFGAGHSGASLTLSAFVEAYCNTPSDFSFEFAGGSRATVVGSGFRTPLRVYDGAFLDYVEITFRIAAHSGVPDVMPRCRAVAVDAAGNVTTLGLGTTPSLLGFESFPFPASGSAWHASGNLQTYRYVCDDHPIDSSIYSYYLDLFDEVGTNAVVDNLYVATNARCISAQVFDGRN